MKLLTYALPVALLVTAAAAQNDPTTGRPQQPPAGTQRPDTQGQDRTRTTDTANAEADRVIAVMVLSANNNEIALARLAAQRASSDEVKQFAQKAMKDHTELSTKLQPLAGRDVGGMPGANRPGDRVGAGERGERSGERTGETNRPGGVGDGRPTDASARMGGFDHVALIRELNAKCLETSMQKLSSKSGAEFDACYMQMQVASHTHAVDALSVFGKHASPQLRSTLETAKSTMQTHLDHAERICDSLHKGEKGAKHDKSGDKSDDRSGDKGGSQDPAGRGR